MGYTPYPAHFTHMENETGIAKAGVDGSRTHQGHHLGTLNGFEDRGAHRMGVRGKLYLNPDPVAFRSESAAYLQGLQLRASTNQYWTHALRFPTVQC
jgi:hypothetical protein